MDTRLEIKLCGKRNIHVASVKLILTSRRPSFGYFDFFLGPENSHQRLVLHLVQDLHPILDHFQYHQ